MKSKANRRVKRVKKTLRTRRKLRKMKGGVFDDIKQKWSNFKEKRRVTYCEKCSRDCPNNSAKQEQTPPSQPPTPHNKNGWYYTTELYGPESYKVIQNDGLTNKDGNKTTGINPERYSFYIDELPDPSKEYKSNGTKYKMIGDGGGELKWQNMNDKSVQYDFIKINPLQITIDGRLEALSLT